MDYSFEDDEYYHLLLYKDQIVARIDRETGVLKLGHAMMGGSMQPKHFPALMEFIQICQIEEVLPQEED